MSAMHSCALVFAPDSGRNQCSISIVFPLITCELKLPNVSCAMGLRPGEQRCWRCCGQGAQVA